MSAPKPERGAKPALCPPSWPHRSSAAGRTPRRQCVLWRETIWRLGKPRLRPV